MRVSRRIRSALAALTATKPQLPPDFSPELKELVASVTPYTMTSPERICALVGAVEYVVEHEVAGAIVECGVWRGGSMMAAAKTLLRLGIRNRPLMLFDTFEGMTQPATGDTDYRGRDAAASLAAAERTSRMWGVAELDEVKAHMGATGYPEDRITYVPGRVEDTVPGAAPDRIALLRLDTDWYQSTKHEMIHLFPRLVSGGVLIVDDYGHWQGARRAVDEYLIESGARCLLCRIDYTGRIAVKQ